MDIKKHLPWVVPFILAGSYYAWNVYTDPDLEFKVYDQKCSLQKAGGVNDQFKFWKCTFWIKNHTGKENLKRQITVKLTGKANFVGTINPVELSGVEDQEKTIENFKIFDKENNSVKSSHLTLKSNQKIKFLFEVRAKNEFVENFTVSFSD